MADFILCPDCLSRFGNIPSSVSISEGSPCHICNNVLSRQTELVKLAVAQSSEFEWNTFSVSSSLPKAALVREAEIADEFLPGGFTSLKNSLNSSLASAITAATGKQCEQRNADAAFSFNFTAFTAKASPNPVFVYGHYLKLSREHCQSRWHCSDCNGRGCDSCKGSGRNYPSVEDELGAVFKPTFDASDCILHASGREDVDVRSIGTGRPFVLEITSPKRRSIPLEAIEATLARSNTVRAIGMSFASKSFMDALCNSHFEKKYVAIASADRKLTEADAKKAESLSGKTLAQQTPKRVLSRRVDIVRKRKVFEIKSRAEKDGRLTLEILAEAGTYIKELISSDGGRTKPSIAGILKCDARCDQLDVVEIRDYFLETVKK
jgi:tRNA pseudouridine synthase 10